MNVNALSPQFKSISTTTVWPKQPEAAANQAISEWGLRQKGWMGFDKLPWVGQVRQQYPQAIELAQTCSAFRPEYKADAASLFESAKPSDLPLLRDYFAGKLGLEELSCRLSGAGAGMCDKRTAFQEIYQMAHQACQNVPATSGASFRPAAIQPGSVLPEGGLVV